MHQVSSQALRRKFSPICFLLGALRSPLQILCHTYSCLNCTVSFIAVPDYSYPLAWVTAKRHLYVTDHENCQIKRNPLLGLECFRSVSCTILQRLCNKSRGEVKQCNYFNSLLKKRIPFMSGCCGKSQLVSQRHQ